MVDGQYTDTKLNGQLAPAVAGVTVNLAAHLMGLLPSVDENEYCVRVLPHEVFQLFVQSVPDFPGSGGKVETGGIVHAVHHKHPALDALEIVPKRKVGTIP